MCYISLFVSADFLGAKLYLDVNLMYEELVRMPTKIRVNVEVSQKGKTTGKTDSGSKVEFAVPAASKLRELAPVGATVTVLVDMVDHPDNKKKGVARWLVENAESVHGLAEAVAPAPPAVEPQPAPTTNGNGELKELLKPVADWLRPLIALATEISDADEGQVAGFVRAQGYDPLISAQLESAMAAKTEAIEAIVKARGEVFVALLVEQLSEFGVDLVEQARKDGIAAIIPEPEAQAPDPTVVELPSDHLSLVTNGGAPPTDGSTEPVAATAGG